MRFIHTSDWHIGQDFYRYDREEEHRSFFQQLCAIVEREQPDALLVSGDIYHTAVPSAAAQKLYTDSMVAIHKACPSMSIIVTAGNHDSYSRLESADELWQLANVKVIGHAEKDENNESIEKKHIIPIQGKGGETIAYVIAIPHIRESLMGLFNTAQEIVRKKNKQDVPVIMMGHLTLCGADTRGHDEQSVGGMDYVEINTLGNYYDYFALGHIHHPQFIKGNEKARYSGSPIQVNFDEMYPHSVSLVEINRHGEKASVKEVTIQNDHRFLTIPSEPLPFEEAFKEFMDTPVDPSSYICLNAEVEEYVPSDAETRIEQLLQLKKCRFCKIKTTRKARKHSSAAQIIDSYEITNMEPAELANTYYQEVYGKELDKEMRTMIREITEELRRKEREEA